MLKSDIKLNFIDTFDCENYSVQNLMIWCILNGRIEIAKILWKCVDVSVYLCVLQKNIIQEVILFQYPIANALIASKLLKSLAKIVKNINERAKMEEEAM